MDILVYRLDIITTRKIASRATAETDLHQNSGALCQYGLGPGAPDCYFKHKQNTEPASGVIVLAIPRCVCRSPFGKLKEAVELKLLEFKPHWTGSWRNPALYIYIYILFSMDKYRDATKHSETGRHFDLNKPNSVLTPQGGVLMNRPFILLRIHPIYRGRPIPFHSLLIITCVCAMVV